MGAGWASNGRNLFLLRIILFVKVQKRRGSRLIEKNDSNQGEDEYMADHLSIQLQLLAKE